MKKNHLKIIFTFVAILNASVFFGQEYSFKNYDWNEKETAVTIPDQYKNENGSNLM